MKRRYLQAIVEESLKHFPAVLITGARQVGKSTLAQALIDKKTWNAGYVTFDDRATLDAALRDSDGFIRTLPTPVILMRCSGRRMCFCRLKGPGFSVAPLFHKYRQEDCENA